MKFPGKRKTKHYFPVRETKRHSFQEDFHDAGKVYIVGIDQLIVDIEAEVSEEFLTTYGLIKGQSVVLNDSVIEEMDRKIQEKFHVVGVYAGGAIGNTLHNYSTLSESRSIAFGAISKNITVGDTAFKYICSTNSFVDLSYLRPVDGPMGKALCLLTPDGERTFAIGKGVMNDLTDEYIAEDIIKNSCALLLSAYSLRDEQSSMYKASIKAMEMAKKHSVSVVFSLGTSSLVKEKYSFFQKFIRDYVTVLAGNYEECYALIHGDFPNPHWNDLEEAPLHLAEKILDMVDLCLLTHGKKGLYVAGHVDDSVKRETKDAVLSREILDYNRYEYSRAMKKNQCSLPVKIYTHINPYMGGPLAIKNTNGAGDGALASLLHDMASNKYHELMVPNSPKHARSFLTYSSIHQISKYANRTSFEILKQNSPRLLKSLPDREESLEDSYWDL